MRTISEQQYKESDVAYLLSKLPFYKKKVCRENGIPPVTISEVEVVDMIAEGLQISSSLVTRVKKELYELGRVDPEFVNG